MNIFLLRNYRDFFCYKNILFCLNTLFKAIESQYFPAVWMAHGKETKHKINRLCECVCRKVYNDCVKTFWDFLNLLS